MTTSDLHKPWSIPVLNCECGAIPTLFMDESEWVVSCLRGCGNSVRADGRNDAITLWNNGGCRMIGGINAWIRKRAAAASVNDLYQRPGCDEEYEAGVRSSVIYRTGELNAEDYDEAIEALEEAKKQLAGVGTYMPCCYVCHDTGHYADMCHHNPLVMVRRLLHKECHWRCFHCGVEFSDEDKAEKHFGKTEHEKAECIK